MTRRARRSTKWRSCLGSVIRAGPKSNGGRLREIQRGSTFRGACSILEITISALAAFKRGGAFWRGGFLTQNRRGGLGGGSAPAFFHAGGGGAAQKNSGGGWAGG